MPKHEDEELLLPDEDRKNVWRFRTDLLRDVAYDSLAKRERQRLHLRVADKLSEPELAERYPRTIAFHLEQAARASLDLNPNDRSIADRAVDALTRAGDVARRRIESRAAVDLYERALALAGPEDDWGVREAWIVGMLGEARYWLGDFDEAEDAAAQGDGRLPTATIGSCRTPRASWPTSRSRSAATTISPRGCSSVRSRPRGGSAIRTSLRARC